MVAITSDNVSPAITNKPSNLNDGRLERAFIEYAPLALSARVENRVLIARLVSLGLTSHTIDHVDGATRALD